MALMQINVDFDVVINGLYVIGKARCYNCYRSKQDFWEYSYLKDKAVYPQRLPLESTISDLLIADMNSSAV
jgi:hypothetical protein